LLFAFLPCLPWWFFAPAALLLAPHLSVLHFSRFFCSSCRACALLCSCGTFGILLSDSARRFACGGATDLLLWICAAPLLPYSSVNLCFLRRFCLSIGFFPAFGCSVPSPPCSSDSSSRRCVLVVFPSSLPGAQVLAILGGFASCSSPSPLFLVLAPRCIVRWGWVERGFIRGFGLAVRDAPPPWSFDLPVQGFASIIESLFTGSGPLLGFVALASRRPSPFPCYLVLPLCGHLSCGFSPPLSLAVRPHRLLPSSS